MQTGLDLLKNTQLGTLFPDHPSDSIISFAKTDSIATAFKGLIENHILSAPVYDPVHRTFNCFVDMVDIVTSFVGKFSEKELTDMHAIQDFSNERCGQVADVSGRDPYSPVEQTAPLLAAILKMARSGIHRIPVIDSEGELVTVVTQSHVVKFLFHNMYLFGGLANITVDDIHMFHAPVVSVTTDQKGIDAFKLMNEKRVSAVAVVDNNGVLVGNISVSDLKLIGFDGSMFSRLYYPISQFMKLIAKDTDSVVVEAPVCVSATSPFAEVV